jgi:hypothetical protein
MDDFEQELRQAFARRPAPPGLKRRLMENRRAQQSRAPAFPWQRIAAVIVLSAVLSGAAAWHKREEQRKGEAVRQQVLTALRITNHALNHMNKQFAAHGRVSQE